MTLVDAVDKFSADGEFDYKQMQGLNFSTLIATNKPKLIKFQLTCSQLNTYMF